MKYNEEYPLTIFLKQNNIKDDLVIKLMLQSLVGFYDKEFINFIKINSNINSSRYKYIRDHNPYHDKIYKKIWEKNNIDKKTAADIYYKEIKKYYGNLKEYNGCHIWGFTRNPYLYNSLWNVWYIPRYCSYLTDSQYGGNLGIIFRNKIKEHIISNFREQIINYNKYMIKNASYFSKVLKEEYNKNKNKKCSLNYVLKQLVLINLKDRKKDVLEILDNNFDVVYEIKKMDLDNYIK